LPRIDIVQFPCAWLSDRLLILAGTTIEGVNLYSASISPDGMIDGPVEPLTSGPGLSWSTSVSTDGRIALDRFQWVVHLWQVELDPTTGRALGEPEPITAAAAPKFSLSLSRDGSLLAYSTYSGPRETRLVEVRLRDLERGQEAVLVSTAAHTVRLEPRLSPDGTMVAWSDVVDGQDVAFTAPVAEPAGRELCRGCSALGFFANGSEILLLRPPGRLERRALVDTTTSVVLSTDEQRIVDADLSWDDRWLAVSTVAADGRLGIAIVPVRDPPAPPGEWLDLAGEERRVSSPRWSPDGRLLYYLSERDNFPCVWARAFDPAGTPPLGEPFPVIHAHGTKMSLGGSVKGWFVMALGGHRLVFNAVEMTGEVYTASLPPHR